MPTISGESASDMATVRDIGFEGLSAFATDVDGAVAAADRIAATPRVASPRAANTPTAPATPIHRDGGAIPAGLKKVGGWVVGIGILLALKACIWGGIHAVSGSGTSSYSASPSDQSSVYDTTSGSADASTDNMTTGDAAVDSTGSGGIAAPTADDGALPNDDGAESKPAPGYASLSLSEIRYCMAEDVRIAAQKTEIDGLQNTDTDRFNRNVDGFNETVNDYNSRCSNRSIMASDRPTATSQVEAKRSQLETEGRSRVQ